ncbi:hypothetical protein NEF87_002647 [Candidatus Lokiarchaeum ossiferum]|uniref:C2H2-type domain-containing protein n=1 Tax=Candidatus Lokiarchaeum ossiferum TaxID=2951803 RepID=A0ABY6HU17_9ARCH|nr:hypothetical protein NEF87_002647 [Candidatus Lokiarchaeum sp. B-35]
MKHIKLRSFPTKCRKCGQSVLFWESTKGAKIFFDLPIYGRPFPHHCPAKQRKKFEVKETYQDHKLKSLEKITFTCPVCGRILDSESALELHIKKLVKQDDRHDNFFNQVLDLISWDDQNLSQAPNMDIGQYKTKNKLDTLQDRFILKTKDPNDKKKFENLLRRKRIN